MMSIDEKKQMLGKAFWDKKIDPDLLYAFVNGEIDSIPFIFPKSIYLKLLSTYDWYTLLSLVPMETLEKAMSDDVLDSLFPRTLSRKYRYARQLLFRQVIPVPR